ncbi:DUF3658 domain-containing protein [Rhizobium sp. CNPSo 4062]|uniref:DUF3658 domain-containing protein n=1 Tax=Rhizobium sp. CNPSo 4062 TaxID=3021410 RepID=UPI00254DB405|nr:DUF3658 domain-containing protein [Rhizobium sp. CNPSo 4062]MDK4704957.1 DUF3658 domain-containing protein [Rhizobium sp. CNPSo 4062]
MKTLHVTPGFSAAGSLREALRLAGREDAVLPFGDDLTCGPINSDAAGRVAWWHPFYEDAMDEHFLSFWRRIDESEDRLVVWFGRHCAQELAFRLAFAFHMNGRPYDAIDVTDLRLPRRQSEDGQPRTYSPQGVSLIGAETLATVLDEAQPVTPEHDLANRNEWKRLMGENAPFRIVTSTGLLSAPLDYCDQFLLEHASPEWQKMARIVGNTMGLTCDPYYQVGDVMLQARLIALIDEGKLIAEGDPWNIQTCRIRLPQ